MEKSRRRRGRRATDPLVAFCFHSPQPGGATVWLRDFLASGGYPARHSLAVFPCDSPVIPELEGVGIRCAAIDGRMGAFSKAGVAERLRLIANRAAMVAMYRRLFLREGVGLVYVNSSTQVAPMIAARLCGLPLVVHVHETLFSGRTHWLKRLAIQRLAHAALFAARLGKQVFSPAPAGARWVVSPNGVDESLQQLRANRDAFRRGLGIPPRAILLLFLGTLCEGKGLHDLLEIWPRIYSRNPDLRLLVAGSPDPQDRSSVICSFMESPPGGSAYLGYRKDAVELVAAADLLVLPSYDEAMPIVVCEAMMVGTPVVARGVGDIPWQIGEGRGFLFEGRGSKVLEKALRTALDDPEDARKRAERAQTFAREHITRSRQQQQIRETIAWTHAAAARR